MSRLFDCFTFFNELDVLEIRLHELSSVVDCFVLVEARETFTGRPKPLYYDEHRDRFAGFNIVSIVAELPGANPWAREACQRNRIADGLRVAGACETDLAMVGDVDEIPYREAVAEKAARGGPQSFTMPMTRFYVDFQCTTTLWPVTQLTTVADVWRRSPQGVRCSGAALDGAFSGLHMTCLGGAAALREKFLSFSHTEMNVAERLTDEYLNNWIQDCYLPSVNHEGHIYKPESGNLPRYLAENRGKYAHLFTPVRP